MGRGEALGQNKPALLPHCHPRGWVLHSGWFSQPSGCRQLNSALVTYLDLTQDPRVKDSVPKIAPTPETLSQVPDCHLYF